MMKNSPWFPNSCKLTKGRTGNFFG